MTRRGTVPPGWEESPAAWVKRIRLVVLASFGLCIASYLTPYRLRVLREGRDPFFRDGSPKVLHLLEPLPGAAVGALAYLTEIVLRLIGGEDRWHTAPWTVPARGFVIFCGAVVSAVLLIIRPVVVGAWSRPSSRSQPSGVDELLAALQYLRGVRAKGGSTWRALWGTVGLHD